MTDLGIGILSIFAEAQRWWGARERTGVKECSDPEEMRRVYRETNNEHGKCRACPAPTVDGRKSCARHLAMDARRGRTCRRKR